MSHDDDAAESPDDTGYDPFEGVFRAHMIRRDGTLRHSAYYSIVADEWPRVRRRIRSLLDRPRP